MGQPIGTFEAQYVGPYMIASKNRMGAITLVTSTGVPSLVWSVPINSNLYLISTLNLRKMCMKWTKY